MCQDQHFLVSEGYIVDESLGNIPLKVPGGAAVSLSADNGAVQVGGGDIGYIGALVCAVDENGPAVGSVFDAAGMMPGVDGGAGSRSCGAGCGSRAGMKENGVASRSAVDGKAEVVISSILVGNLHHRVESAVSVPAKPTAHREGSGGDGSRIDVEIFS